MSKEFDDLIRVAFPVSTDTAVRRSISTGVSLADDTRRNTPWLMNLVGTDLRGNLRRSAAMWQVYQDCKTGNLPFEADEVSNTTGSSHLLRIRSANFDAHIVRTDSEAAFPKDAPIRQDRRLSNEADLFRDGELIPVTELGVRHVRLYSWLSFNADPRGELTHLCWCMPEHDQNRFLAWINILRGAGTVEIDAHVPPPPDPKGAMKFKRDVIERVMDTKKPGKTGTGQDEENSHAARLSHDTGGSAPGRARKDSGGA